MERLGPGKRGGVVGGGGGKVGGRVFAGVLLSSRTGDKVARRKERR